jgi:predicted DNA-binding ribbon-helix-helix protein
MSRAVTLSDLVTVIDSEQRIGTLASAIRVFVLGFYRDRTFEHKRRNGTRQMWATITTATTRH